MPIRRDPIDVATRRARHQLDELVGELVGARHNAGLSQAAVARACGVSRPLLSSWERGSIVPTPIQLGQWGAVVGLDVSIRAFPGGAPLRDAGQLRLLERFRRLIGDAWGWRTEVAVSSDPSDRRAIDAMLTRDHRRVGVEAIGRLVDVQAQIRPILLKQRAAGLRCLVVVLGDSRHNRAAVVAEAATIRPAFPCPARTALVALRSGEPPPDNAAILV